MTEEQIFAEAMQLPVEQREAFVQRSCAGDAELRKRVEQLLKAHDAPDSLLEVAATLDSTTDAVAAGRHPVVGNYKLLHKLGEGGFGVVYMAEQMQPVRRKVALKIVKAERMGDATATVARFEAERQALAMMDHPNIATVFDGGSIPAGSSLLDEVLGAVERPFFVMELVNGVPITEYCDKNNLLTRERLKLFVSVCLAVQHAHQKGVIHRDLKPSNILVTLHDGVPVVKIIDFGVAKAINQQLTDKTLYTVLGDMIGTPLYMSPEQAERSGLDIDTRSDIYSLGVLLYELLTGTTPLTAKELKAAGVLQIQRCIVESEPPKPSTRLSNSGDELTVIAKHRSVSADRLHKELQGDLDWIVMKALEKDRQRRYDTAKGFAVDVERYLNDEAVFARPPSTLYLLRKTARKHKSAVITGGVALTSLLAILVGLGYLYFRERDLRESENSAARALESEVAALQEAAIARMDLATTNATLSTTNYALKVESAFRSLEKGNLNRLEEFLGETEATHQQGFEWRLLKQQYEDQFPELTIECGAEVVDVRFSPKSDFIVALLFNGELILKSLADGNSQPKSISTPLEQRTRNQRNQMIDFIDDRTFVVGGSAESPESDSSGIVIVVEVVNDLNRLQIKNEIPITHPIDSVLIESAESAIVSLRTSGGMIHTRRLNLISETFDQDFQVMGGDSRIWGDQLVTTSSNLSHTLQGVWISNLTSGETIKFIESGTQPGGTEVSSDLAQLFVTDSSGIWTLRKVDGELSEKPERIGWRRCTNLESIAGTSWLACAGSDDNAIRIIDLETGLQVARLLHKDRVVKLHNSEDGQRLVSGSEDGTIKVWEVPRFRRVLGQGYAAWFAPFSLSGDGKCIAYQAEPHCVHVTQTGSEDLQSFQLPDDDESQFRIRTIALSSDGALLAVGTKERAFLWDTSTGKEISLTHLGSHVTFSPDDRELLIGDEYSCVLVKLVNNRLSGRTTQLADRAYEDSVFEFSNDSSKIAIGGRGSEFVKVWERKTGEFKLFNYKGWWPQSISISPDNKLIAISGLNDRVKIYDLETEKLVDNLKGNGNWLTSAKFSADGSILAAASPVGEIKFWRMPSGEAAGSLQMEKGLRRIHFGPDGNRLYWSSMDGEVGYLQAAPIQSLPE